MTDTPTCSHCWTKMGPVFNAETGRCNAWYCDHCGHWEPVVGRERLLTMGEWHEPGHKAQSKA